ncbi:MAG TPA: alpha/beta hydrolase [Planctomycetaceae bacterium]
MFRRPRFWCSTRPAINRRRWLIAALLIAVFTLPNLLAYFHARAMTKFSPAGARTAAPENLSLADKTWLLATGVTLRRPTNQRTPQNAGVDYETEHLYASGLPALEIWRIPGASSSRPIVVMFHGYGSCKSELLAEALVFHEFDCDTILVDFRGSGGSDGNETTLGVHEAKDVARAFEFARASAPGRPIVLYGKSMGSAAILRAVATGQAVPDGIIVECPFDRLLSTVENRFSAMNLPSFPMARLLVFWGGVQLGMNGFDHNPVEYAARVKCPTLLLHGERDVRVTVPEIRSIYDCLAGEKELVLFPDAGHESYLEVDSERWRKAVCAFCAQIDQANRKNGPRTNAGSAKSWP